VTTCPVKRLRLALLSKGFQEEKTHHRIFWLVVEGKRTRIRTRLSHGIKEYGTQLLHETARALMLSRQELDRFVRCPMDYEEYLRLIRARCEP
jgi:hypothetical protein